MALTRKQKVFIDSYLITFNATEAARQARYKGDDATLASVGWENLRKPEIAEAIEKRLAAHAMNADEVLKRLAEQGRGSMSDFVRFRDNGDPSLDLQAASLMGKLHLVKKLKTKSRTYSESFFNAEISDIDNRDITETTIEFELYSSQAALELIGKHHGLFDKRGSEEDPVHTVDWTVEQWREERSKRQRQAAETMDIFGDESGDLDDINGDDNDE